MGSRLLRELLYFHSIEPHPINLPLARILAGGFKIGPSSLLIDLERRNILKNRMINQPLPAGQLFFELSVAAEKIEMKPAIPLRAPEVHHFACLVAVQGQETNGLRVRGPRERRHNIFSALMKFVGRILAALDVDHVQGCNRVWITGLRKALLQKCRMNLKKVDEWISWHRAVIKPKIGNLRTVGRPLISPFRLSVCQFLAVDPILHAVENCGAAVTAELADVAALQIYNVQIIGRDKTNLVSSR